MPAHFTTQQKAAEKLRRARAAYFAAPTADRAATVASCIANLRTVAPGAAVLVIAKRGTHV